MTGTNQRRRRIPRVSPIALLAALLVGCGTSGTRVQLTEEQKIQQKIAAAYDKYAPRYEGDDEYDIRILVAKMADSV